LQSGLESGSSAVMTKTNTKSLPYPELMLLRVNVVPSTSTFLEGLHRILALATKFS